MEDKEYAAYKNVKLKYADGLTSYSYDKEYTLKCTVRHIIILNDVQHMNYKLSII